MDKIEFVLTEADEKGHHYSWVSVLVNGVPLAELVRDAELQNLGGREPMVAGRYEGLWAADVLPPSKHYFGEPRGSKPGERERVMVMGCSCGEPGCWPLECFIDIGPSEIVWQSFRNPHLSHAGYEGVGPFRFDRSQYEGALAKLAFRASQAKR